MGALSGRPNTNQLGLPTKTEAARVTITPRNMSLRNDDIMSAIMQERDVEESSDSSQGDKSKP